MAIQRWYDEGLALAEGWRVAGRWDDALTLLRGLDPLARDLGDAALARQWTLIGRVLTDKGGFGAFDTLAEREAALDTALAHAKTTDDPALLGNIWDAKGMSLHHVFLDSQPRVEDPRELEYFERGLALRRQVAEPRALARSLFDVGLVYGVVRRDHAQATPYFEEAYRLATEAGDQVTASYAIRHLAFAYYDAGDMTRARAALTESLELREAAGFMPGVAMALVMLAYAAEEVGDLAQARAHLALARDIFAALGSPKRVAEMEAALA